MGFEKTSERAIEFIDIEKAHKKALGYFTDNRIDPNEDRFLEAYGGGVSYDLDYVKTMKGIFDEENKEGDGIEAKKLAMIFEAIIADQIYFGEWFGPNADTVVPAEYDGIKNRVDLITEFEEEERKEHLALAIDVTFGVDTKSKFERIKKEIDTGKLTEVKYFSDEEGNIGLRIPRVVIGVDSSMVKELMYLWMGGGIYSKKELNEHIIQMHILEEMEMQLVTFEKYAMSIGRDGVAESYNKSLKIIKKVLDRKFAERDEIGITRKDRVRDSITESLEIFNQ